MSGVSFIKAGLDQHPHEIQQVWVLSFSRIGSYRARAEGEAQGQAALTQGQHAMTHINSGDAPTWRQPVVILASTGALTPWTNAKGGAGLSA